MTMVSIIGNIGSGKSTMSQVFGKNGFKVFEEPVEGNPFLESYYKDPVRWGLTLQMFMLHYRFNQHLQQVFSGIDTVSDSSIYSDFIFAELLYNDGTITKDEFNVYLSALENLKRHLVYPDAIVYIKTKPEDALERIKQRARGCEVGIPLNYLQKLDEGYERMVGQISQYCPVILIDAYDSIEKLEADVPELIKMIKAKTDMGDLDKFRKVIKNWKL